MSCSISLMTSNSAVSSEPELDVTVENVFHDIWTLDDTSTYEISDCLQSLRAEIGNYEQSARYQYDVNDSCLYTTSCKYNQPPFICTSFVNSSLASGSTENVIHEEQVSNS